MHADNQARFYLNGVQFFQQQPVVSYANFQDPADELSTPSGFTSGLNTVTIDLVNGGDVPSAAGLDSYYTVCYLVTGGGGGAGCPTTPAVAERLLRDLEIKPNSATGRYVVAHMAVQATFGFEGATPAMRRQSKHS